MRRLGTAPLARLQGDLSKIRGQFAASREEGIDSDLRGDLMATRQQLTEEKLDEFLELIPYRETRGYVRAVLRNRALYAILYPPVRD